MNLDEELIDGLEALLGVCFAQVGHIEWQPGDSDPIGGRLLFISLQHCLAAINLLREGLDASASALIRSCADCGARSIYAVLCASKEEIEAFKADKSFPFGRRFEDMAEAIRVAERIESEVKKHKRGRDAQAFARRILRTVCLGYLEFAMREPGIFRTAFSPPPEAPVTNPTSLVTASPPFRLFSLAVNQMQVSGLLPQNRRRNAEYLAWSSFHGLALLAVDGPLNRMPRERVLVLGQRLVATIEDGLR